MNILREVITTMVNFLDRFFFVEWVEKLLLLTFGSFHSNFLSSFFKTFASRQTAAGKKSVRAPLG